VRYIGCSTYPAWKVMEALMVSEQKGYARCITEQSPYNLLDRCIENELVPLAPEYNLGLLLWSPLAMGILVGTPRCNALPSALHLDKRRPRWAAGQERPDQRGLPGAFCCRSIVSHRAYGVGPAR
jgi:aryl-alcohol dehydrogenase-like predicted oxidoreductase